MEDWKSCPACKIRREMLKKTLEEKYGRVTKEEYSKLQEDFEKAVESDDGNITMKIDYEYAWDESAQLCIRFKARCDRCSSTWNIEQKVAPIGHI